MEFFIAGLYAVLITAIILRWRFFRLSGISIHWIVVAFIIKLIAGFTLWKVYTSYYTEMDGSDATRYYHDAMLIKSQLDENPAVFYALMVGIENHSPEYEAVYDKLVGWYSGYRYGLTNDYRTIVRLQVIISFISFGSYHVHWIIMSFLSLLGLTWIFKCFESLFKGREFWLFAACFLLPSVVFWSSGLLKEGPALFGLGLLFFLFSKIINRNFKWYHFAFLIPALGFLFYLKQYVLLAFIPAAVFLIVIRVTGEKFALYKFLLSQIICFIIAQNAHYFFVGGDFLYVLGKKRVDFENTAALHSARSSVEIPESTSTVEFLLNSPQAFALTYLRPYFWESKSWMYMIFALENLVYVILILFLILFFRRIPKSEHPILIYAAASFALVMASIVGNCVPVLGSVVRYRILSLPLLIIVCCYFIDFPKIKKTCESFIKRKSD
jgi:hypothetical protein